MTEPKKEPQKRDKLKIPLSFDDAVRAALQAHPPERPRSWRRGQKANDELPHPRSAQSGS